MCVCYGCNCFTPYQSFLSVQSFVDQSNNGLDGVIPREVLENAKGFAIFTVFKAGFVFSARAGSGVVIAKLDNGSEQSDQPVRKTGLNTQTFFCKAWSAPGAIGIAGIGLGSQAGAEMTDFLIVLNSRSVSLRYMDAGSFAQICLRLLCVFFRHDCHLISSLSLAIFHGSRISDAWWEHEHSAGTFGAKHRS